MNYFCKIKNQLKNKIMEKSVKIEVPDGYEIDKEKSNFEQIVFKKKDELPKTWYELKEIRGHFIAGNGSISDKILTNCSYNSKHLYPTKELAEAALALCQLLQLRERYNEGWQPDFRLAVRKYCIMTYDNEMVIEICSCYGRVLSFKTQQLAERFLENFKDLLEIEKPLL